VFHLLSFGVLLRSVLAGKMERVAESTLVLSLILTLVAICAVGISLLFERSDPSVAEPDDQSDEASSP
jgi:hypothetical protein